MQGYPPRAVPLRVEGWRSRPGVKGTFLVGSLCCRDSPATWECWCDGDRERERKNQHNQVQRL